MSVQHSLPKKLIPWFEMNQRDLPWRCTYSPYHVWISEIMLQQTQMERGVLYFERWIKRFPDIASITNAEEEEIFKLWEGLGYYSRARNIQKTAAILTEHFGGELPDKHQELLKLPGIGPYTAGAIMSIAFNKEFAVVDANVERLFSRLFDIDKPVNEKQTKQIIWQKVRDLIPANQARFFNQALMELGALICLPQNPKCDLCPVSKDCVSLKNQTVPFRPIIKRNNEVIYINMVTGVLIHDKKIFIQKRPKHGVWANLWEFPGGRIEKGETPEQALIREYLEETEFSVGGLQKIATVKHSYTKYRVTLHGYYCKLLNGEERPILHAAQEYRWVSKKQLADFAFPAGHRKLIQLLKSSRTELPQEE